MKFEEKHYYKVCSISTEQKTYQSYAVSGQFAKEYAIGKVTRPIPGTVGLFVLGNYKDAIELRYHNCSCAIFKCRVKGPVLSIKRLFTTTMFPSSTWLFDKKMSRQRRIKIAEARSTHSIQQVQMYAVSAVEPIVMCDLKKSPI